MSKYLVNIMVPVTFQIKIEAENEDEAWDIAEKEGYDRIDFSSDAIDDDKGGSEVYDVMLDSD